MELVLNHETWPPNEEYHIITTLAEIALKIPNVKTKLPKTFNKKESSESMKARIRVALIKFRNEISVSAIF